MWVCVASTMTSIMSANGIDSAQSLPWKSSSSLVRMPNLRPARLASAISARISGRRMMFDGNSPCLRQKSWMRPILADQTADLAGPLIPVSPLGDRAGGELLPQRIGLGVERPGPAKRARRQAKELLHVRTRFEKALLNDTAEIQQQGAILPGSAVLNVGRHSCLAWNSRPGFSVAAHRRVRRQRRAWSRSRSNRLAFRRGGPPSVPSFAATCSR